MSDHSTRREFLRSGAGLALLPFMGVSPFDTFLFAGKREAFPAPRLSFSTLGCPDWSFTEILDFAASNGYQAIELRGILRQLDLPQCPEFQTATQIASSLRRVEEKGLSIVDLGSSAELHSLDEAVWQRNLDGAKRFIDLAQELHCPFIRVFPNLLPKDQQKEATLDRMARGLLALGDHAKGSSVSVLMETHGDLLWIADLKNVMQAAKHPHTGLVWDVYNMWSVTKEPPARAYAELKDHIRHTHIKDGITVDGKEHYTLLGKGEAPVYEAIAALTAGGYTGFYSFEWEKMWHPEIEAPELALADYPKAMAGLFARLDKK